MILADIYELLDEEEYDIALDAINDLLISHPDSVEVLLCKAHILHAQRHFDLAEKTIRVAIGIAPDQARIHFALLNMLQIRGNLAEIEAVFAAMLACPDFADTIDVASYATYLLAIGHLQDALVMLERGIYLHPISTRLRIVYGDILRQQGQIDNAAHTYSEALQLAPEDVVILHRLGELENDRGNLTTALSYFQTAVRLHPHEHQFRTDFTHTLLMVSFPIFRLMQQIMAYPERKLRGRTLWSKIGFGLLSPLIVAAILAAVYLPLAELIVRFWLWGIGMTIGLFMFVTAWIILLRPLYMTLLWLKPAYRPYIAYHFADGIAAFEWGIFFVSLLALFGALPILGSAHIVSRICVGMMCASAGNIVFSYGLRLAHSEPWFIRVGLAYLTLTISIYMGAIIIALNSADRHLIIVAVFLYFFGMISFVIIGNKAQNSID